MKLKYLRPTRIFVSIIAFLAHFWYLVVLLLLFSAIGIFASKGFSLLKSQNIKPSDLLSFFGSPQENLASTNSITNFLLLGVRGEAVTDSPDLSDTIIIFSYNHLSQQSTLISIPRDLWVPSTQAKINASYHYGELASPSGGIKLAQASILEVTGLPIHYTAVINFTLFEQIIDQLGGVDVQNDFAFTDTEFPIPGLENALPVSSRYETISFDAGLIHLDGQTALKFVRSRHAEGEEGTDFARSKRQQAVITGLRQKVLNAEFLLDENKIKSLLDVVNRNLKTNLDPNLYPTLAKIALDTKNNPLTSITLSTEPDADGVSILFHPDGKLYQNQYVLIPKDNNYEALKLYIANHLLP